VIFQEEDDIELLKLLEVWKKILRLQDWTVRVRIKRLRDMSIPDSQGVCSWTLSRQEAVISLIDPVDYDPSPIVPLDHETTLVHELLHLHFAYFTNDLDSNSLEHVMMERTIDTLAKSLVNLHRSGR
jgi:hypothetical protein